MSTRLKIPLIFTALFLVFVGFVYYNYSLAQRAIRETRPSPLSIDLVSFPEEIKEGGTGNFIWHITSSPDLTTNFTTIYWGYDSSPSALTKQDTPAAVKYPYSQTDYLGSFRLPDTFDVNILFSKAGTVWFRAYAEINGEHLWSAESSLRIVK